MYEVAHPTYDTYLRPSASVLYQQTNEAKEANTWNRHTHYSLVDKKKT